MKIAICLSGAFRQVKKAFPSYRDNLLKPLQALGDVKVYFSAWDSKIKHFKMQISDDSSLQEVLDLYKPDDYNYEVYDEARRKALYVETCMDLFQRDAWTSIPYIKRTNGRWAQHSHCLNCHQKGMMGGKCRICGGENVHNQIGMLYNICQAFLLTDYRTDLVIRTRFDNIYQERFSPVKTEAKTIYIPEGDDDFPEYGGGCNDQFAYGTWDSMRVYSTMFYSMGEYAQTNSRTPGGYGIPHMLINNVADRAGFKIARVPFKYALQKRLDGR